MRFAVVVGLVLLVHAGVPRVAAAQATPTATPQVRVTARIVVIDREAFTRAGLAYAVLGADRVRVVATGGRAAGGVRVPVGMHGARVFLEAVRASEWVRSESTQQVLTMSGAEALVSSQNLLIGRRAAQTRGPSLVVVPTVLPDGRVHLSLSARVEDRVTYAWGYAADGSPAAVDTEIIAADGEEIIVGSSSAVERTRESGILRWGTSEQGRDVLVAITAQVTSR
jgi:Flp pilus assembly secretin CpaC